MRLTLKNIIKFINDDSTLKSIFYNKTKNHKYKPRQLAYPRQIFIQGCE